MTEYGLEYLYKGVKIGDIIIQGKPLRDWCVEDIGTSYVEYGDWAQAVYDAIDVGDDFNEIISQEFHDAFYTARNSYVDAERRASKISEFQKITAELTLQETGVAPTSVEVLFVFEIAHPGWELDNQYAVMRVDGVLRYVGTDHGHPRFETRESIESHRARIAKDLADLDAVLAIV